MPHRPSDVRLTHPEWSRSASIYQVNTRQLTPEGTLEAARAHLPRIAALGVTIVWLMPVHEIGREHRKGTLGSPYAVRDYHSVSAELGTLDDLKAFVADAHALGLRVILDWVANHTAWDNPLLTEHPEWYARDWKGDLQPSPWWDWDDIIDLDYSAPGLREWMTDAMVWWVREADVDGFRCDVAGFVPTDFWEDTRAALEQVKPVFMLAEWESRELHDKAFDMTYGWTWHESMHRIAAGQADANAMRIYYAWNDKAFQADCYRMLCVTNHDMNAWEGTEHEIFGDGVEAAVVLSVVSEGMPLLYSGQESGSTKRLAFFERDPIEWGEHPMGELYRRLIALKTANHALWNGTWGGRMVELPTDQPSHVLGFVRRVDDDAVAMLINLSPEPRDVVLRGGPLPVAGTDLATREPASLAVGDTVRLEPWGYRVVVVGGGEGV